MTFGYSSSAWATLVIVPSLILFLIWAWRRKQQLISQFVTSRLLANLTVGVSTARQKARLVMLATAVTLTWLALARPQWGFEWEEARSQGLDILVAIDTSKSMLASDITPTRLARAKLAVFDLMKIAKQDRLGLIAFAGSAFLQTPLTLDEEAFRQNVETLDTGIIPQGGTALADAIETARKAFETSGENHKVLVLFTDGEDQDTGALEAAERAAKEGMKIYTIGVGTAEGELIQVPNEQGQIGFLKDEQGNVVKSHLNEGLLQQIATAGGGFYLPLRGANPMETLYHHPNGLASLPKAESTSRLIKSYHDRFYWFLVPAIVVLIAEMFLPQRRRNRGEAPTSGPGSGLTKVASILIAFGIPLFLEASPQSAQKKFETGDFDGALQDYEAVLKKRTNDFRLFYNAGDAAYRAKRFDAARKYFDTAVVAPEITLQQHAYYNLGNALYQLGEQQEDKDTKKANWEQSIRHYQSALKLNKDDTDARHNLAFVTKKLEDLKKEDPQKDQNNEPPKDPSEAAKRAKEEADEAVRKRDYKQALSIMEQSLKRDSTTQFYADYIQRLREVNGVAQLK
jgi:Ca-activated chloride channel family protein